MKAVRILIAAAVAFTAVFFTEFRVEPIGDEGPRISFGVRRAEALYRHRVARRTARRVARRHAFLPAGCPLVGLYYYCGGIYYQPVVEAGSTVYIVVTP
jgi:hypothetical protein